MNEFSELVEYCVANGHYLAFNYSPFDGTYQVYVNPGRAMTSAKRHKSLQDAVRMCWAALGGKPLMQTFDEEGLDRTNQKNIRIPLVKSTVDALMDQALGAACGVSPAPKKRGRPKGSKNRPKEVV